MKNRAALVSVLSVVLAWAGNAQPEFALPKTLYAAAAWLMNDLTRN